MKVENNANFLNILWCSLYMPFCLYNYFLNIRKTREKCIPSTDILSIPIPDDADASHWQATLWETLASNIIHLNLWVSLEFFLVRLA